jgi:hypothetical protein
MGRRGLLFAMGLWAAPAMAGTRVVRLDEPAQVIPGEIALGFTQRLTFILPEAVRMAVPGSPDVLAAHVKDNVVVASLVESEYVRAERPVSNLTILTEDGTAVTCRIRVAERPEEATTDVVRVERGEGLSAGIPEAAVRLLHRWLTVDPDHAEPAVAQRLAPLEPLFAKRGRHWLARNVADGGLEVVPSERRTKRDFIYLASQGLARVGGDAVLHLEVTNHSQPAFTVGDVTVRVDDRPVEDVLLSVPDGFVPPDGKPRGLAVLGPADRLLHGDLAVSVCERGAGGRCVTLQVR